MSPPLLVFSPHLDDAVLSMGNVIGAAPGTIVVTLLAGEPRDAGQLTSFDKRCGFRSAAEGVRRRRAEDASALKVLGARAVHLDHPDGQYGDPVTHDALVKSMRRALRETRAQIVAGPLGVTHPDHEVVADAWAEVVDRLSPEVQCWVYEDLPGRVLEPEHAARRREWWTVRRPIVNDDPRHRQLLLGVPYAPAGPEAKVIAVRRYRSQLWALDPVWHPIMCPERLWQVIR